MLQGETTAAGWLARLPVHQRCSSKPPKRAIYVYTHTKCVPAIPPPPPPPYLSPPPLSPLLSPPSFPPPPLLLPPLSPLLSPPSSTPPSSLPPPLPSSSRAAEQAGLRDRDDGNGKDRDGSELAKLARTFRRRGRAERGAHDRQLFRPDVVTRHPGV